MFRTHLSRRLIAPKSQGFTINRRLNSAVAAVRNGHHAADEDGATVVPPHPKPRVFPGVLSPVKPSFNNTVVQDSLKSKLSLTSTDKALHAEVNNVTEPSLKDFIDKSNSRDSLESIIPNASTGQAREVTSLHEAPITESNTEHDMFPTTPYWTKIEKWKDVSEEQFLNYAWQTRESPQTAKKLFELLRGVLPDIIPTKDSPGLEHIVTRDDFIQDVSDGMGIAPMSVRITPHILAVIDWTRPLEDPIRRQFLPMKSTMLADHPSLELDSLHETEDAISEGLIHRYPDKALFLAVSVCPVYCRFCTRSYSVGANTSFEKKSYKPARKRWDEAIEAIRNTPALHDIVISGGDSYYLQPHQLLDIGKHILDIPNIKRIRYASKGLAVCPSRFLDPNDGWTDALIEVSNYARLKNKSVAMHTHFNHPNEITWITEKAAFKLYKEGVRVRNQSVLLKGVNDDTKTMHTLIHKLADNHIDPYYVYQGDMVKGVEDLRTPLSTILKLESEIRGTIAGFACPQFIVDLPGGGGKRAATSWETYDRETGISTFVAPGIKEGNKVYEYHDPAWSLPQQQAA